MSSSYDSKSCNALEKVFYYPIEVAIRWCNLVEHEAEILHLMDGALAPNAGLFPQWPCLRLNTERVFDAIENNDLPHGRDGKFIQPGDHVAPPRRTVRHADLKEWMQRRYPDQKPIFLFDEIERTTHTAINADSFRALQVDRDALKARIDKATEVYKALKLDRDVIASERDALLAKADKPLATTERQTLLVLIAAMCRQAKLDWNAKGVSVAIESATEEIGAPVTDDTIRKILKQIDEAVTSRSR